MTKRTLVPLRLALLTLLPAVGASAVQADAIDDYVQKQMKLQHIPGLSLIVVKDGKTIKAKGYGFANLELGVPATADTVYEVGSITKQFTSMLIMMLVEENKIGLGDKITKFLDKIPDAWKDVTVRQLLTHTSGIHNYTEVPDLVRLARAPVTPEELIKTVADKPLDFPSGEKWHYSNTGYFLLGMIVEKASGKRYDTFLQERILTPLGMTSTHLNDLTTLVKNRATGYDWNGTGFSNSPQIDMTWPYSAGAIVSSVNDMARWDAALYTERLVKKSSLQQIWTPVRMNDGKTFPYGFGWSVETLKGHSQLAHSGGIPGFVSHIIRYPDDRVMVCALTNTGCDPERISETIAHSFVPAFAQPKAVTLDEKQLSSYTGYYNEPNGAFVLVRVRDKKLESTFVNSPAPYEWEAENETTFFSPERTDRMTFLRASGGAVTGFGLGMDKPGTPRPRLGPLFREVKASPDPDTALTGKIETVLKALGQGGKAEQEVVGLADGARKDFARAPMRELADLKSLSYVGGFDIASLGVDRHGGKVARLLYYKASAGASSLNLLVYLTSDNQVTDYDIVSD